MAHYNFSMPGMDGSSKWDFLSVILFKLFSSSHKRNHMGEAQAPAVWGPASKAASPGRRQTGEAGMGCMVLLKGGHGG